MFWVLCVSIFPRLPFMFTFYHSTMKVKHFVIPFLFTLVLITACRKNDGGEVTPDGDYQTGVFVVNEGPWGGSGSITWYNPETQELRDSIFEKANGGASLGQFVQSLTFHNGKGYIVVNGANRIVVVDGETFKFVDTIGGLALPRFFMPVSNSVAFVSQWGADGLSGSLAKIDLNFNKVLKTYPTGAGPEKMLYFEQNKQLFVANSGGYGVDSTITSFQVDDENSFQTITVSGQRNPASLSRNQTLGGYNPWNVLCKGDWTDPNSSGWLGRAFENPQAGVSAPKGSDDLATSPSGVDYFSGGTAIYRVLANGSLESVLNTAAYGFNIHPVSGQFYCADAKDFNSRGTVSIFSPAGVLEHSFTVGIAPGEIVFKL